MSKETSPDDNHSTSEDAKKLLEEYEDYYELIGLPADATETEIDAKAKQLMKEYHPDNLEGEESLEVFKKLNKARSVLTESRTRKLYDSLGHEKFVKRQERGEFDQIVTPATGEQREKNKKTGGLTQSTTHSPETENVDTSSSEDGTLNVTSTLAEQYKLIANVNMDLTITEKVQRVQYRSWIARLGILFIGAVALLVSDYLSIGGLETTRSLLPASLGTGEQLLALLAIASFSTLSYTLLSTSKLGIMKHSDEAELGARAYVDDEQFDGQPLEEGDEAEPHSSLRTNVAKNTYDPKRDHRFSITDDPDTSKYAYQKGSLIRGGTYLCVATALALAGSLTPGMSLWVFIAELPTMSTTDFSLWFDTQYIASESLLFVSNVAGALLIIATALYGTVKLSISLDRYVWHQHYRNSIYMAPLITDILLLTGITCTIGGLAFAAKDVSLAVEIIPTQLHNYVGLGSASYATTYVAVGTLLSVLAFICFITTEVIRESIADRGFPEMD